MIIYFADRQMNILGQASTSLPRGFQIVEDLKTEEIETGVATFSCRVVFDDAGRTTLEKMTEVGNYLLRSNGSENEFYTIIDAEIDTKNRDIYIYAEDAGLDLINEIVGDFEATEEQTAKWYIEKYIADSGFEIGLNEISATRKLKLSWEGESTVTARLASIATQFGGYEISYSYDIKGLDITHKYVNIHEKRGKDNGVTLRLNMDIDKIVTTKSVANLATAFLCEGGVPDNADTPITFSSTGYKYDDGDFYISRDLLISRKASEKWKRHGATNGYIVRPYSYDTTEPGTLKSHALAELKKVCDLEVNYEVDIKRLPEGVKIGDRINIVDDAGEMYVSTRVLLLEVSVVDCKHKLTLGENLIKTSGISQRVEDMAAQFASTSQSAARALTVANNAATEAATAKETAEAALASADESNSGSNEAREHARRAATSASTAQTQAEQALAAAKAAEEKVAEIEDTVENANTAANNAATAAQIATTKAEEAKTAADNAATVANEAKNAVGAAQTAAAEAMAKADTVVGTANEAKTAAESALTTVAAAKADAEKAQQDVDALGEELEELDATMQAYYARKTELTETKAALQTQITQNAASITSVASQITTIDETANDAKEKADAAQTAAGLAQSQADQATADAQAAQNAANVAASAAASAQSEADTAKAAAEAARSVADKAESDLEAAKADLETVTSRVDATEEEIEAAQAAVEAAQTAADEAKADADTAVQKATEAQTSASTAVTNAANAQTAANEAANKAALAQQVADQAKGDATAAQTRADEAASIAAEAQRTAAAAVTTATSAQAIADQAATDAAAAQQAADDADAKAAQAQSELNTAKQNLADVTSRVDATEAEVEAAQAAVLAAQEAADNAADEAEAAQATADTAKANAATAQTAADNARQAADNAQTAAEEAQAAADKAQADVNSLAVRVTTAETKITQNSEQIALMAKKTEVAEMLGGYSTKAETEAAITLESDSIKSSVSETYSTNERVEAAESLIQQLSNCIAMLVTDENGESLMTQTENGWTFSMKETAEAISDLISSLEVLQAESGSTQATVDILRQAVSDHGATLEYVNITTYEDEPCIELGESDSDFKLLITNTRIMFMNAGNVPTYINTNGLVTQDIEVKGEIVQGGYVMLNTSEGGWGLLWKGVSN